ncbi:MAG TPA: LamB/YcsF family protein [Polyangiaceae bacterium]
MPRVDLNIDLGELPNEPEELYALATVVNIACGGHAGDAESMARSVERAVRFGARVAAHPSYPDRAGFGRAHMAIAPRLLYEAIVDQTDALAHLARRMGTVLWGAKMHGALYHDAATHREIAGAVLDAVVAAWPDGVAIMGPPWGHLESESRARGLSYVREGFADRRYGADGKLVSREKPDALVETPEACAEQALALARGGGVETVCVHGDRPDAVAIARAVRRALENEGFLAR